MLAYHLTDNNNVTTDYCWMCPVTTNMTSMEMSADSNPYLDYFNEFVESAPKDFAHVFNDEMDEDTRQKYHNMLDVQIAMVKTIGFMH